MSNPQVKVTISGDSRGLVKAADEGVKALSRLEKARASLAGGKVSNTDFTQFSTLSKQQLAEVHRISKERQKLAETDTRVINQQKISELRVFEATEKSKLRLAEQSAKARAQAENNSFKAAEAAARRSFSEHQRLERERTRVAQAEARKRSSFSAERIGSQARTVGQGTRSAGIAATAIVTAPVVLATRSILTAGIEYEKALNTFQAVTRATNEEMAQAADTAKRLGADITLPATSAKDAALAMTELAKAGLSANEAMAASKGVLQLAAAGQLDEARAAEIAANALNSFRLAATETTRVADLLAAAANASSAGVSEIADSMQQASAVFAGANIPIETLVASISLLANAGIKGSDAGTSLKTFLQRLQSPTDNAADAMKGLGVEVFDAQGKMRDLPNIIGQFDKALSGLTEQGKAEALTQIFGSDAIRAAQILFRDGEAGINKMTEAVTRQGAAAELAGALTKGLGGLWGAFGSQMETIGIEIFEAIKTPLTNILQLTIQVVTQVGAAFSQLSPNAQTAVLAFVGIVAAIGPVLIVVGSLISAVGTLITAYTAIAAAVAATGITFSGAALIIGGIIVVLAAVGVAAYALYQAWITNFGNIQGVTSVFVADVSALFSDMLAVIQPALDEVSAYAMKSFADIKNFWDENGAAINQAAATIFANVLATVKDALDQMRAFWETNGEAITSIVSASWSAVKAVISGAASIIGNSIKLIAAVINGDWTAAWAALKGIVSAAFSAAAAVIAAQGGIILGALRVAFNVVVAIQGYIVGQMVAIGQAMMRGLVNGITASAGFIHSAVSSVVSGVVGGAKSLLGIHSPSTVFAEIGGNMGEGLAVGVESKTERVKTAVKKMADATIKELNDAAQNFTQAAGISPEQANRKVQADEYRNAASGINEIIKLRAKSGVNVDESLPQTIAGVSAELKYLQEKFQAAEDAQKSFDDSLENLQKTIEESRKATEKYNQAFDDKVKAIEESGAAQVINLQEEINLTGVASESDRERIKNYYDIQRLREQMANDGYGQQQIDDAARVLEIEQGRSRELLRILDIRKQVAEAGSLEKGLSEKLLDLQNGNQQLTEYEKTLRKISEDFKDISPAQKDALLNTAAQIDAQKEFNEQYKKTYDFIRGALDVLTDGSKSFGEKMKSIFGSIAQSFKKMLLDMVAQWLSSKLMKAFNPGGTGSSGGSSSGGGIGGIFSSIKKLFGGSSSSSGSGKSSPSQITNALFGAGGSNTAGVPPTGTINAAGEFVVNGNQSSGGILSSLKGMFGPQKNLLTGKTSAMAGKMGGIGAIASLVGGFLPGKLGSVVSMAGTGMSIGANFGPWGAAIGAGIGALIGLFGGDPKKKQDKKENLPALQKGFADALAQLRSLGADRNALFSDPDGTLAKAVELRGQIASGFGITFQSKKYQKQAQIQIAAKLSEADAIISRIRNQSDEARQAFDVDKRLETSFAGGVYMDAAFLKQFKRRNGMLAGGWTGKDTLPSMLAQGELVLNPVQQARIVAAARHDIFKDKGIPGYAGGTYVAPSFTPSPSANTSNQPINITIVVEGEIDAARIKDVVVDGMKNDSEMKVQVVKTYDNAKLRVK